MGENRGKKHSTALLYLPGRWGASRCLVRKGIKEYFVVSFRKLCMVCLSNSIEKWFCGTGDNHRTCMPGCNHYLGIPQTRRKREPRLVSKKHKIRNMGVYNLIRRESQWYLEVGDLWPLFSGILASRSAQNFSLKVLPHVSVNNFNCNHSL